MAVVGGCLEFTGAPFFASMSALKVGAGRMRSCRALLPPFTAIQVHTPNMVWRQCFPARLQLRQRSAVRCGPVLHLAHGVRAWRNTIPTLISCLHLNVLDPQVGADMAYVVCTPSAKDAIKSYSPELMVLPYLPDDTVAAVDVGRGRQWANI